MFRIDEIAKQHKELFPLADESGQINKLQEELTEYMVAGNDEQKKERACRLSYCVRRYISVQQTSGDYSNAEHLRNHSEK